MGLRSYLGEIFAPEGPPLARPEEGWRYYRAGPGPTTRAARPPQSAPSREEFDAWFDDPATQFVLAAFAGIAAECKAEWERKSWEGGAADPVLLTELRARADAYRAIAETDYTGFCEQLGLEPRQ